MFLNIIVGIVGMKTLRIVLTKNGVYVDENFVPFISKIEEQKKRKIAVTRDWVTAKPFL